MYVDPLSDLPAIFRVFLNYKSVLENLLCDALKESAVSTRRSLLSNIQITISASMTEYVWYRQLDI